MVGSVKIVATPTGVKVEGEGYTGQACSLDVARVLAAMNISPGEAQPKPEFYVNDFQSKLEQNNSGHPSG